MVYFLFFLSVFAISFAFIESSIVIYLRKLYYPEGFSFPLKFIQDEVIKVEFLREISSIFLIFSVSVLSGKTRVLKVASFFYIFGLWDIFYYIFLYIFLKWPKSFYEWDLLFLVPIPWVSPVYAPLFCSLSFIIISILVLYLWKEGYPFSIKSRDFTISLVSLSLILISFFNESKKVILGGIPEDFPFFLYFFGLILFFLYWVIKIFKILFKNYGQNN